ncbi:hypothetical protein [Pedobacter faecalis]|uniref:hypothetical protein n=1 Tax=Pedobacter faecalis TaxID=3041495 RepID=UPI00254A2F11|nr:hypothetical protein [Pedobacter sp. ELA7]
MKRLIFLSLVMLALPALAQKNLPVSGNAATLIDLLKKNYNSLDPETRQEEIARDRALVISIFKSYLTDDQRDSTMDATLAAEYKKAKDSAMRRQQSVTGLKKQLTSYMAANELKVEVDGETQPRPVSKLSEDIDSGLAKYYEFQNAADSIEMRRLKRNYQGTNVFISNNIEKFIKKYNNVVDGLPDPYAAANFNSSLQKSIPFLGGSMGFETYIDGLARFMAQRIKDELTTYAIENIKTWLENPAANDPLAEFKVILPGTTMFIKSFSADRLTSFPNEVKQHIENDLNNILTNAAELKYTPRTRRLLAEHPNLEFAFDALRIVPELASIKYPIDYFKLLENSETLKKWKGSGIYWQHNLINAIELSNMIAYSMIVIDNEEPKFAGTSFLENYAGERAFFELYTGFLYQQDKKYYQISFKTAANAQPAFSFGTVLGKVTTSKVPAYVDKYRDNIQSMMSAIATKGEKVYTTALEIRQSKKTGRKIGADTVYNFVNSVIDMSDEVLTSGNNLAMNLMADSLKINTASLSPLKDIMPYLSMARSANDIIYDLQKKRYATALTKSLQAASEFAPSKDISTISAALTRLTLIKPNENIRQWHTLAQTLINNRYNTVEDLKAKIKEGALVLAQEVRDMNYFYLVNYKGDPDLALNATRLRVLREMLLKIETLDISGINEAKSFLKNPVFQKLLVSYYADIAVDKAAEELGNRIVGFTISGVQVFDKADAARLTKLIDDYSLALYDNFVMEANKEERTAAALARRQELLQFVSDIMQKTGERTDLGIHPRAISMINFVNGMATAKDAEGVQKAIEAFALPAGSYSIKRKSRFNMSLGAYPGVLPALEITWKNKVAYGAPSVGFTAPVGLSFTWGREKTESTNGFFLPVIDIGALTRFRLDNNNDTQTLPEFKFGNIFSPGIYYVRGFRKSPLTFYLGGQYGPDMREVSRNADNTEVSQSYQSVRLGVGLVLDIPLLNLSTKSRL